MKFEYVVKRDEELELRARTLPYLFSPFSFEKLNCFLAGTGIEFYDHPIDPQSSYLFCCILNAYLREFNLSMSSNTISYVSTKRCQYTWHQRKHRFYMGDATVKIYEHAPALAKGIALNLPQGSVGDPKNAKILEFAAHHYAKEISSVFGIESNTRIDISLTFEDILVERVY